MDHEEFRKRQNEIMAGLNEALDKMHGRIAEAGGTEGMKSELFSELYELGNKTSNELYLLANEV